MQTFFQYSDGRRVALSKQAAMMAQFNTKLERVISTPSMEVYRKKNVKPKALPKFHYGGRHNSRCVTGYRGA